MKNQPAAIVIGANIGALSIIRSLGRRSIQTILLTTDNSDYAAKSRYCRTVQCENFTENTILKKLQEIASSLDKKGVLFCTKDSTVLTVTAHRAELEELYHFVLPSFDVTTRLMSKQKFHEFATANGFAVPQTFFISGEEDIAKVGQSISYPCVIKPEFRDDKWVNQVSKLHKVLFAKNREEYQKYFYDYHLGEYQLIVQEWIEGSDAEVFFCLTYLNRKQEPLAVFTGQKIRQFPLLTGSTALAVSRKVPFLAEESIRLLQTAGCVGPCSVEFKFSKKSNRYFITEPTVGRVDTQEGSSISSGMDIPFLAYSDALGLNPIPVKSFQEGISWINEPEDYSSVRNYRMNGQLSLKELIASYKGKRAYALIAMDDPLPFITFLRSLLNRLFRKFSHSQN